MFRRLLTQTYAPWRNYRLIGTTALTVLGALVLTAFYSFAIQSGTAGAKVATITVCAVGCDHTTIQAAVTAAAANDTISVAAGTYIENVTLNKSLILNGAQTGVTACGRSATETIIAPAAGTALTLLTGSAGAIINGFTFSGGARGIESGSGPLNNLQILNNRFTGFTGAAIFLNDSGTDITVHQNEMDGGSKTSGGGTVHLDTDGFDGFHFTNNCVKNAAMGSGLFSDGNRNVGLSAGRAPLFDGNVFENHTTNVGVNIGSRSIEDATFSNNIFRNNAFDGLQGGPLRTTFSGNSFVNNGRHGLALTSFGNLTAGRGASFVTIKGNLFSGNGFTMVGSGILYSNQPPATHVTNHANLNRIVGNATGVTNSSAETIDVENNWWGCNFGPGTGGAGCSGTPNALGGTGVATIDADPWLVLGITAVPNTIGIGGMSNLTADLTFNSDEMDTSGSGNIPNGTPVAFAGMLGTVAPSNTTTTGGKANSVFTGTMAGTGSASSTVDMQTASTPITITQAPTITCPSDIVRSADPGQCTAVVTFNVTPTGNPPPTVMCIPSSGSAFTVGTTTVNCTASNGISPDAMCSFTVTVQDTQAPAITCPANIVKSNDPNQCGAVASFSLTINDNCPNVTASCSPVTGSFFPVGTTTVTCTASDVSPDSPDTTCTFTVTVNDTQAPVITCPPSFSVGATSASGRVVTYPAPTVGDNCPGVGAPTCTPASGSNFPVGVTTVNCTVSDAASNSNACSFTITVGPVSFSVSDPLNCTGPGNTVTGTFTITNNGNVAVAVSAVVALPAALPAVPGTCITNVGTCTINNPTNVSLSATLAPGQTATVSYLSQVSDQLLPGTTLCALLSVQFGTPPGPIFQIQSCVTVNCPAIGPGSLPSTSSPTSDQKSGSVLIYNVYTSGATSGNVQNTRINVTNVHPTLPAFVHLFFVAEGCSVADSYICLTGNQTASFLASDFDPGTTGYIVAIAVDDIGCPANFNYLIGDEYVKFASGHEANLGVEAIAAITGGLPVCDPNSVTATLAFDGVSYNLTPRTLALSNIGSRADGNDTLLILNRIGGNLGVGASTLGTLFGILYDDAENSLSFSVAGNCQLRGSLSNNFPRTAPRFESFIPAGRTGWLRIFSQSDIGITGAAINFNANSASSAGAFNQGHNLHVLTLSSAASYIIPVFPPSC